MNSFSGKYQLRSIFVFVVLFAATLPFPLSFFPSAGDFLHPLFRNLNHWTAVHIFGMNPGFTSAIESDSTGFYIHLLHLLVLSLLGGLAWIFFFKKGDETKIRYWLYTTAAYLLAFFLLKYGWDKVFKVQFYLPEPNTLYTPLGALSKDILFWSAVGSSYSYSVFSGLMEIIPAFLLLYRKTRLIGGLIAFGVMLHVLVINFSFDISVKILSCWLLLLAAIVIRPYASMLAGLFISGNSSFIRPETEQVNVNKKLPVRFLKALAVAAILFESLFAYVENNQFNDDLAPRPRFHGAYEVQEASPQQSVYFGDLSAVKRVFVHRRGYLIFQLKDETMQDFPAALSFHSSEVTVQTGHGFVSLHVVRDPATGSFHFTWKENKVTFRLTGRQIDLQKLPLLQNDFIWSVDQYQQN